ncbi:DoxX family protein [Tenacibaculum ovolyticum]|uniref:DoxX family protein n=1 Tax=Tenacibaculum ovolyticum TaxID=104270 RepID=UPI00040C5039|nr:DoxX family membrane protein [Tenacibaculum ovolyticum]
MKYVFLALKIVLAVFLIYGGYNHFQNPEFYNGFIPDFLPKLGVNYISGIIEILLGIGLFKKGYEKKSAYGIFLLMIAFMPIHIWDAFKEVPAIGSKMAAYIRIAVQVLFIVWAYVIYKNEIK